MVRKATREASSRTIRTTAIGIAINTILAAVKGVAGVLGNSYALVADAVESAADVVSSIFVLVGVKLAEKPADESHPYGHGKFEPLAAMAVAVILLGAAIAIGLESIHEILTPHHAPAPYTLLVLVVVVVVKEALFRFVLNVGTDVDSTALKNDAWHHRSDAFTSLAAFIGITVAIIGGKGYESADDYAALFAAVIIAANAIFLMRPAVLELLDTAAPPAICNQVRSVAATVPGVFGTHKCHVRKVGFEYVVDLDILCDPDATIRQGHDIAHQVVDTIHEQMKSVGKVLVHVEPVDDFGRRAAPRN